MDIFGIGAAELFFILLIAIIILGPKDMEKAGRTIGRFLNQLVRSDSWKVFQKTSTEIRNLPRNLMREANLEEANREIAEAEKEVRQAIDPRLTPPGSPSTRPLPPSNEAESAPPDAESMEDDANKNG